MSDQLERLTIHTVKVPARRGSINSGHLDHPLHKMSDGLNAAWTQQFDAVHKCMLVAETRNGLTAYGESLRGVSPDHVMALGERFIGRSIDSLGWRTLPMPRSRAHDAFELLVLDLLGKAWGVPVHQILGGAVREQVWVSAWSGHRSAADAADIAATAASQGFTVLKLKCNDSDDIVGIAKAVRDSTPEGFRLIFDPNERWNDRRTALPIIRSLETIGNVMFVEDPLPRWDLSAVADLRRQVDIPVALHIALGYAEHGQRKQDVMTSFRESASDAYNLSGCTADFLDMAASAEIQGIPYWRGSEVDLGVMEAGYLHSLAVTLGAQLPSDVFGRLIREHDLLTEPLKVTEGHMSVPTAPGLGVELDQAALEHYAVANPVTIR